MPRTLRFEVVMTVPDDDQTDDGIMADQLENILNVHGSACAEWHQWMREEVTDEARPVFEVRLP